MNPLNEFVLRRTSELFGKRVKEIVYFSDKEEIVIRFKKSKKKGERKCRVE